MCQFKLRHCFISDSDFRKKACVDCCCKLPLTQPTEVEKFVQSNTQELAKDKWLCPLSGKKFKGPDFVRKHIFNKHAEKVEEVKKEVSQRRHHHPQRRHRHPLPSCLAPVCLLPPPNPPSASTHPYVFLLFAENSIYICIYTLFCATLQHFFIQSNNSVQFHSAALYSSCEGQFHNDRLMNRRINSKEKQLAEGRNTDKKLTILLMCNYKVLL